MDSDLQLESPLSTGQSGSGLDDVLKCSNGTPVSPASCVPQRISKDVLSRIIRLYQQHSYSVWPVVDAHALLQHLDDIEPEKTNQEVEDIACLATALCAATMAQLHIAPVVDGSQTVDSGAMARACLRIRGSCDSYRQDLNLSGVLVSFFLHVYHAKANERKSAMMYIQEAISGAMILRLDEGTSRESDGSSLGSHLIANKELVFPLLWISER